MTSTFTGRIDLEAKGVFFLDLVAVELRKAFNTVAARWYTISLLVIVALIDLGVTLVSLNYQLGGRLELLLAINTGVLGVFLPLIPILLLTQEWGQRSALGTFALEPRRHRVVLAKLLTTILIVALSNVVAFFAAGASNLVAMGLGAVDTDWHLTSAALAQFMFGGLLNSLVGFAFAAVLLNSPASIVTYFLWHLALPTVSLALTALIDWWAKVEPWVMINTALSPLYSDLPMHAIDWAHVFVCTILWIWLPLAFGFWRIMRSEVK